MKRTQLILEKSISDVKRIKEIAKCCIFITPDGVIVNENPNFILEVVAVIGPYQDSEINLPEAVLLEVGMNRSRPYGKAEGNVGRENRKAISKRYGHYQPTPEQYLLVAPHLFSYLTKYATEKIRGWKNNWHDPRWIKVDSAEYRHFSGQRRTYKWLIKEPCVRFSIDIRDEFLLSDIYWAELFGVENRQYKLERLASLMGNRLSGYKIYNRKRFPKNWMNYPRFASAIYSLKNLPWYLQVYIWKKYFGSHSRFHYEIMEQIGYQGFDPWEEILRNKVFPFPEQRLQVKVKVLKKSRNRVIFELYPKLPEESEGYDDEIPF